MDRGLGSFYVDALIAAGASKVHARARVLLRNVADHTTIHT
jgi:hypothetical protein